MVSVFACPKFGICCEGVIKNENNNFCKDGKHYCELDPGYLKKSDFPSRCTHPTSVWDTDLVTGDNCYRTCDFMRTNSCGSKAKLFEQKKPWWKLF